MESHGIWRAQKSTNHEGDGKFCLSNILALAKNAYFDNLFLQNRIDRFSLYVMFSHLIEVFIEVFIKKSVTMYMWLYNQ